MNEKQRELFNLMSCISEECYCATWYSGIEYDLWAMLTDSSVSREYGQGEVTQEQLDKLWKLFSEVGGWFYWQPYLKDIVFIPMIDWLTLYYCK